MTFLHFCGGKGKPNTSLLWFRNSGWLISNLKTDAVGDELSNISSGLAFSAVACRTPGRSIQLCFRICGAIITTGTPTSRISTWKERREMEIGEYVASDRIPILSSRDGSLVWRSVGTLRAARHLTVTLADRVTESWRYDNECPEEEHSQGPIDDVHRTTGIANRKRGRLLPLCCVLLNQPPETAPILN